MQEEDWQPGESLDAFNDLLNGGFGALANEKEYTLVGSAFEKSRKNLGREATEA